MLATSELTRDVICLELIEIDKIVKSLSCEQQHEAHKHIVNIASILMSPNDFTVIPKELAIRIEGRKV